MVLLQTADQNRCYAGLVVFSVRGYCYAVLEAQQFYCIAFGNCIHRHRRYYTLAKGGSLAEPPGMFRRAKIQKVTATTP